ncbi:MAG: hypothetical protein FJ202_10200 [Gemmatimonadetes bacterium]|nr:hypothetical protein [Gemmatimonadota bacterium]
MAVGEPPTDRFVARRSLLKLLPRRHCRHFANALHRGTLPRTAQGPTPRAARAATARLDAPLPRKSKLSLQLSVLAYNLGNLWRRLVLPKRIDTWSLTSLQQRLVKTGARLVKHARYYWLFLAESHLTRRLFGAMLQRIWALPVPAG